MSLEIVFEKGRQQIVLAKVSDRAGAVDWFKRRMQMDPTTRRWERVFLRSPDGKRTDVTEEILTMARSMCARENPYDPTSAKARLMEAEGSLKNYARFEVGGGYAPPEDQRLRFMVGSRNESISIYPEAAGSYGRQSMISSRMVRFARSLAKKLGLEIQETMRSGSGRRVDEGYGGIGWWHPGESGVVFLVLRAKYRPELAPISVQSVGGLEDLDRVSRRHQYRRAQEEEGSGSDYEPFVDEWGQERENPVPALRPRVFGQLEPRTSPRVAAAKRRADARFWHRTPNEFDAWRDDDRRGQRAQDMAEGGMYLSDDDIRAATAALDKVRRNPSKYAGTGLDTAAHSNWVPALLIGGGIIGLIYALRSSTAQASSQPGTSPTGKSTPPGAPPAPTRPLDPELPLPSPLVLSKSPTITLTHARVDPSVAITQAQLTALGYGTLRHDGISGTATRNAMSAFLLAQGLSTPDKMTEFVNRTHMNLLPEDPRAVLYAVDYYYRHAGVIGPASSSSA